MKCRWTGGNKRKKTGVRFVDFLAGLAIAVCVGTGAGPIPAVAQDSRPGNPGFRPDPSPMDRQSLIDLRRRLIELDKLLSLESLSRAESLLRDLGQHSYLARELVPRRIRLAQLKGEHQQVLDLCRRALVQQPANPGLDPMYFEADQVAIQGIVIGVIRKY